MSTSSKSVRDIFRERLDKLEEEMRKLKKQYDKSSPPEQPSPKAINRHRLSLTM